MCTLHSGIWVDMGIGERIKKSVVALFDLGDLGLGFPNSTNNVSKITRGLWLHPHHHNDHTTTADLNGPIIHDARKANSGVGDCH